jgi:formylglycine-generating enzyme required for sulfatase activity
MRADVFPPHHSRVSQELRRITAVRETQGSRGGSLVGSLIRPLCPPKFFAVILALFACVPAIDAQPKTNAVSKASVELRNTLSIDLGSAIKMHFILIQPGSFLMGSEAGRPDEKPVTKVTITKPFYLGKFEVTQEQWQAVMGTNGSYYTGTNMPVEQVSWNDCQEFIAKLKEKVNGYDFRLPTEAEWEYACRAGTTTEYSHGDGTTNLPDYAWFTANAARRTHPVGERKANPWGLHDIHGNIWEWCQDWYGPYSGADCTDPTGPTSGTTRVIRGGSWSHGARDLWSSFRLKFRSDFRFRSIGVRLVATQP